MGTNGRHKDVIILGGGIAGLSAAVHLLDHGVRDILVLEARDRIGGRVHVVEHNGKPLHLGAHWIHQACPENSMLQLAKK